MAPERTCVGCRVKRPKHALLRVARSPEGEARVDPGANASGRGAYVCRDQACVALATEKGSLARALRVRLGAEDLATVRREMEREVSR